MSQSPQPAASSSTRSNPSTDPLLALVLDGFACESYTAGLTLTVGGNVICGNTTTESAFIAWVAEELRQGHATIAALAAERFAGEPQLETVLGHITTTGETLAGAVERGGRKATANRKRRTGQDDGEASDTPPHPRRYVYLSDVVLWTPGGALARLAYWRAPLSAVTGWSIGRIDPDSHAAPEETAPPSSTAGTGAPDAVTVLTQFARGFIDAYRAERERQKGNSPGGTGPAGASDFAKEWARKMEQGRRGDAFADEFADELDRP